MRELVAWFIGDLEKRVSAIRSACDDHDAARLRVLAHQLAGAASGYGFDEIGDAAREVEGRIRLTTERSDAPFGGTDGLEEEMLLSALSEKTEDLITLCRRAIDGRGKAAA